MAVRTPAKPARIAKRKRSGNGSTVADTGTFFRALLEKTGDIVTLTDGNRQIIYISPAIKDVLGHAPDAFIGEPISVGVHSEDRERMDAQFAECTSTSDWVSIEHFRLPHIDGSWRWMETRIKNLLHDENVRGILCVSRDVTEARNLEHQLHEAERLARFGHWRWAKGAECPNWSEGVAKILDRTMQTMPVGGDWYAELIHPDDRNVLLSQFLDAFETRETLLCTSRFLAGDGSYRYIKTYAYAEPDARGEIGALVGLAEDVTQEVVAREALERSEAKYRLIAEQASDIIHHISPDAHILYVSPSVESVLGYPIEEVDHFSKFMSNIHPDDLKRLVVAFETFMRERDMLRMDYRFKHKDGHYLWLETTMRAVRSADGTLKEIISMSRDMSERKKHELQLMEARERAEAANRTKSRFLANMSHELRTPLNAIIGFSDMLKLEMFGKLGNPRYVEYAHLINQSGGLLLDLISDILDMSKIEAGKYDLHREMIDVNEVVAQAVKLVAGRADAGGLTLKADVSDAAKALPVYADSRALTQILLNLLSNAVKFTPTGGMVQVSAQAISSGIRFVVSDTGRGIAKSDIPRLAHAFEQVSNDAELSKQGTGLGLALVRSLAELHGGRIEIESELGQGTSVSVDIPVEAIASHAAQ